MRVKFCVGFVVGVFLATTLCGCSTTKGGSGKVSHQVIVCGNPDVCKKAMAKDCKKGGTVHQVGPAIAVEYSCNP